MSFVYILAAILIFGVLIAVHELGHFLAAKLCGVQVNEFSIGMGPAVWHRKKGETAYSFRILPIGGYCAMEGEDGDTGNARAFTRQGFWKKFVILAAGAFMNFLTGLLIVAILFSSAGTFFVDGITGLAPEVSRTGENGLQAGDQIYKINGWRTYFSGDAQMFQNMPPGRPAPTSRGSLIRASACMWDGCLSRPPYPTASVTPGIRPWTSCSLCGSVWASLLPAGPDSMTSAGRWAL